MRWNPDIPPLRKPAGIRDDARPPHASSAESEQLSELSRDLRRLAGYLVHDPGGADDVVQEAWLAALERPPSEVRTLSEWMHVVVRRLAQKLARRERRRADVEALVAIRDEAEFDAEIDSRLAMQQLLRAAVDEVAEPARAVLVAHYFDGRTLESVAEELQRPLETVRTQRRRGLAELRAVLERRHKGDRSAWAGFLAWITGGAAPRRSAKRLALGAAVLLVVPTLYLVLKRSTPITTPGSGAEVALEVPSEPSAVSLDVPKSAGDAGGRVAAAAVEPPAPPAQDHSAAPIVPLHRLAVKVLDADGVPVPDALVRITASLDLPDPPSQITDAQGQTMLEVDATKLMRAPFFAPPAGGVAIRARAAGHAYSRTFYVPIPEDGGAFDLVLGGPEQIIDVHVVDVDGQPVAGAFVEFDKRRKGLGLGKDGLLSTDSAVGADTDSDGRARVRYLETREHELDVSAAGFVLYRQFVPNLEPRVTLEVRLDRGATLVGEVRRADGSLVADAEVSAPKSEFHLEEPPKTRTGADGRFRLAGLGSGPARIFARGPRGDESRADTVLVLDGHGETNASITLRARPALRVRVQDARSESVAGLVVVLSSRPDSAPAWSWTALADATGTCTLDGFPSEVLDCLVLRGSDGHVYKSLAIDARLSEEALVLVDAGADAPLGSLRGIVLDARGVPLTGAYVHEIRDDVVQQNAWLVDVVSGAYDSSLVTEGLVRWIVVAHQGVADLGQLLVERGSRADLGTLRTSAPGRARVTPSSALPPGARLELWYRMRTATGMAAGRVRQLAAAERELELLPYEYTLRVLDASGSYRADVEFRVTSASLVEVALP
ncbi:MAG: sigma-70 family RNA polymerase sigma factor [Planctomycetes bacterium]|nr:sigma-70 family RNA polymerase sigma factor [Planctomycetota bacterium]